MGISFLLKKKAQNTENETFLSYHQFTCTIFLNLFGYLLQLLFALSTVVNESNSENA